MTSRNRRDDWLDDDEYPSDDDVEHFGEDSPLDYDPLSIGYYGERPSFWTRSRIIVAVIAALLLFILFILPLLSR